MSNRRAPASEFSQEFVSAMEKAMLVSFYKYGSAEDAFPAKVDALESAQERVDKYLETGNKEYLIDAANFFMLEFMYPSHPRAHYTPTDSDQSPGRVDRNTGESTQKSNAELSDEAWREMQEFFEKGNIFSDGNK